MRIVCQKCAAAYAIDDRQVTAKGVRAQCPRCRHLQLVKRDDAAAAPAEAPKSGNGVHAKQPQIPAPAAAPPEPARPPPVADPFALELEAPIPRPQEPTPPPPAELPKNEP